MRWQRVGRWIVVLIGVGSAVAIVAYSRRRPEPPPRPPVLATIDPNAKLQGGAGQTIYYRVGKTPITITFGSTRAYDDGRGHFDDVRIEGLEESRFTVTAKVMETSPPVEGAERPKQMNLSGGVTLVTEDGLELRSDTGVWNDATSQLSMPGHVDFKKGRLSGTSSGADYDRERDAFTLLASAQAHVDVDAEGHGGADLSSTRMVLVRDQHVVQLEGNAKIVGETQTLTSRTATLSFTEDETKVKYLEMVGGARVAPNPGTTATKPSMNADRITMSFYDDGATLQHATLTGQAVLTIMGGTPQSIRASWIDLTTARDGQTLTGLQGRDKVNVVIAPTATTVGRTITATTMRATGDDKKGLTSARFEGSPRFDETPATATGARRGTPAPAKPARWGTSVVVLVLTLDGKIDAIERAEFQQNAVFHDGDTVGEADIAQYEDATGLLHLLPNAKEPRRRSHVATPDMQVDATTIDVETASDDLRAQGGVTTRSSPAAGGKPAPGALFSGDAPIIGSADTLRFTKSSGTAVYTGTGRAPARLKQDQSEVSADRIEYSDTTQNLNASGNVDSTWMLESGGDGKNGKELKSQRVRAETLAYKEAARTAIYTGTPVHVKTSDSDEVEGRTVTFQLADASRELRSMRSEGDVSATLSGGYEADGHVLVYEAKADTYTLEGLVGKLTARVKSPSSDSTTAKPMCSLNDSMQLQLDRKTGSVTIPGKGQAPRDSNPVPCSTPLRSLPRGK